MLGLRDGTIIIEFPIHCQAIGAAGVVGSNPTGEAFKVVRLQVVFGLVISSIQSLFQYVSST